MTYEMLVLDLDGTLTNSKKKITEATRNAIIEIQEAGKKVVLASGRPTQGIVPLAEELQLKKFGSYILSFNGGRIIHCGTNEIIYNKVLPKDVIAPVFEMIQPYDVDLLTYSDTEIWSSKEPNKYTKIESFINHMDIVPKNPFVDSIHFPINKLLITGEPETAEKLETILKDHFHGYLNIYRSEPFFLEIMPQNIDKANSLQKLLNSIGLTADQMICCGDGYNDLTMIEYAGLGVAMANAQPLIKEKANHITKSNDEDGVLYVIDQFMR